MHKVGIFGWGVVAPQSKNIEIFAKNLEKTDTWLQPFEGFGPSNFLAGIPDFDFLDYKPWIDQRFAPGRFSQLIEKMDMTSQYAIGAFIQSLQQNLGIEQILQKLGSQTHIYVSTALGNITTMSQASLSLYKAQRRWNRFWAHPANNSRLTEYLKNPNMQKKYLNVPLNPQDTDLECLDEIEDKWWNFWMMQSIELAEYLDELKQIDQMTVTGNIETGKLKLIRDKEKLKLALQKKWNAPSPPWNQVSANFLWNIHNTPAAQIAMMGKITGLSMAPVAACATFNICLKMAIETIKKGDAKAVVIGASETVPTAEVISSFVQAKVAAGCGLSKPLTGLRGTHVSGGSAIWILGEFSYMKNQGFKPFGMEPVAVGASSDACHIITPSRDGPRKAIHEALEQANITPKDIVCWDLHATATPGDYMEINNFSDVFEESVLVSSRKGTFGHGLGVSGGWELTAQYLCYEYGRIYPTVLKKTELNQQIKKIHQYFVFDKPVELPKGDYVGKLSMGVGGINGCVISKCLME